MTNFLHRQRIPTMGDDATERLYADAVKALLTVRRDDGLWGAFMPTTLDRDMDEAPVTLLHLHTKGPRKGVILGIDISPDGDGGWLVGESWSMAYGDVLARFAWARPVPPDTVVDMVDAENRHWLETVADRAERARGGRA